MGIVDILISAKDSCIDINAQDQDGNTLLHYAFGLLASDAFIQKLLDMGADSLIMNNDAQTPLDYARSLIDKSRDEEEKEVRRSHVARLEEIFKA